MTEGDVYWADLPAPSGSEAGLRRPVVVVQADWVTRTRIGTVICVPLTTNLGLAEAPGNVGLSAASTGLKKDSVAVASAVVAVDKAMLDEHVGRIPKAELRQVVAGIDLMLAD